MAIKVIDKHTAKLIVEVGKGRTRSRRTRIVTYTGKRDLQSKYDAFKDEVERPQSSDITVEDLLDAYIKNRKIMGLKPTTEHGYECAKKRIIPVLGDVEAKDLTTYEVEDFVAYMAEKYSTKTISNTIFLLNAAYERAIRTGQLQNNPCANASLPKRERREIKTLSPEEVSKLISVLENERLDFRVGYGLCLMLGLRRSEVLGIREEDINIPFRFVSITRTRHIVDGKEHIQTPKTERSRRTLALPQVLLDDIVALIEEHHSKPYCESDYLIQDGFGQPMSPSNFSTHLVRIEKRNGITPVSVHGLRHTFATLLNAEGIDIAQISAELGHSNITTTLNTYMHVFGGATASSRGIADKMNSRFGTPTAPEEQRKTAEA